MGGQVKNAVKRPEIPHVRFHDLRHTFADHLIMEAKISAPSTFRCRYLMAVGFLMAPFRNMSKYFLTLHNTDFPAWLWSSNTMKPQ
jgi:hypothetical protein